MNFTMTHFYLLVAFFLALGVMGSSYSLWNNFSYMDNGQRVSSFAGIMTNLLFTAAMIYLASQARTDQQPGSPIDEEKLLKLLQEKNGSKQNTSNRTKKA